MKYLVSSLLLMGTAMFAQTTPLTQTYSPRHTQSTASLDPFAPFNEVHLDRSYTFVLSAGIEGSRTCIQWTQPTTGGPYTVKPPDNVLAFFTVGTKPGRRNMQCFAWYAPMNIWLPLDRGIVNY